MQNDNRFGEENKVLTMTPKISSGLKSTWYMGSSTVQWPVIDT